MANFCSHCGCDNNPNAKFCADCGNTLVTGAQTVQVTAPGTVRLQPGQVMQGRAPYTVDRPLSKGGMGAIYLAHETIANQPRLVVVKELLEYYNPHDPQEAARAQKRFEAEAAILARLNHPGIPLIFDYFSDNGRNYIVMQYIEGQDLGTRLTHTDASGNLIPGQPYLAEQVIRWGTQICKILEYLEGQNIVHMDIKPANLILDRAGEIWLVDFGTAKGQKTTQLLTGRVGMQQSSVYGTAGYAPPEQYAGKTEPRSDVYALAATLYHLLTDDDPGDHPHSFPQLANLSAPLQKALQPALTLDVHQRLDAGQLRTLLQTALQAPAQTTNTTNTKVSWGLTVGLAVAGCFIMGGFLAWRGLPALYAATETPIRLHPTETASPLPVTPTAPLPDETGGLVVVETTAPPQNFNASPTPTQTETLTPTPTETPVPDPPTSAPHLIDFDLAFASDREGDFRVYLLNTLTGASKGLPGAQGYQYAWWPTFCGAQLAAEVIKTEDTSQDFYWIYFIDPNGNEVSEWSPPGQPVQISVPRCSADGQYLAYSANQDNAWLRTVVLLDGNKKVIQMKDDKQINGYVSWAADNNTLLSMIRDTGANVYKAELMTNVFDESLRATQSFGVGKYPAISPDARQMVYVCKNGGWLCLVDLSSGRSTDLVALTYMKVDGETLPATAMWSGDGQWIYFSSADGGDWDIFRIHPDGSGLENMTASWTSHELMPALQW